MMFLQPKRGDRKCLSRIPNTYFFPLVCRDKNCKSASVLTLTRAWINSATPHPAVLILWYKFTIYWHTDISTEAIFGVHMKHRALFKHEYKSDQQTLEKKKKKNLGGVQIQIQASNYLLTCVKIDSTNFWLLFKTRLLKFQNFFMVIRKSQW